jgi:hypothetical protein
VGNQPGQRPVTTCVYKPEAENSLWLLMMRGIPFKTFSAFNKFWNNKFHYKVASCLLFLLINTKMHGSMDIKLMYINVRAESRGGWYGEKYITRSFIIVYFNCHVTERGQDNDT